MGESKRSRPGMEKSVSKISIKNQPGDFAYWQTCSYQERLDALEQIRQKYHR